MVDKHNNTYHRAIKIKPYNIKKSAYIDIDVENNDKDPKFKVADLLRIWKYKNDFAKYLL